MDGDGDLSLTVIRSGVVNRLARCLELEAAAIRPDVRLTRYGLDSVHLMILCGEIEDWLGVELEPATVLESPTIAGLAGYLHDLVSIELA